MTNLCKKILAGLYCTPTVHNQTIQIFFKYDIFPYKINTFFLYYEQIMFNYITVHRRRLHRLKFFQFFPLSHSKCHCMQEFSFESQNMGTILFCTEAIDWPLDFTFFKHLRSFQVWVLGRTFQYFIVEISNNCH